MKSRVSITLSAFLVFAFAGTPFAATPDHAQLLRLGFSLENLRTQENRSKVQLVLLVGLLGVLGAVGAGFCPQVRQVLAQSAHKIFGFLQHLQLTTVGNCHGAPFFRHHHAECITALS